MLSYHIDTEIRPNFKITSPGTRLRLDSDLYLSVCMFGRIQQTECIPALFPLTFLETFVFERVFHSAYDLAKVIDILEETQVRIDLIQASNIFDGIRVLAWYQDSAKNFLYPAPVNDVPLYRINDRELFMRRSPTFSGISPKLEFSTRTTIFNSSSPKSERSAIDAGAIVHSRRTRSRTTSRRRTASQSATDLMSVKPPFVVRKVEDSLIGRRPILASSECEASLSTLEDSNKERGSGESSRSTGMDGSMVLGQHNRSTGMDRFLVMGRHQHNPHEMYGGEEHCAVCRLYRQYYGRAYSGHASPARPRRTITHY